MHKGGQNVNKLNTKVEIRFHVDNATWLSDHIKNRLKILYQFETNIRLTY